MKVRNLALIAAAVVLTGCSSVSKLEYDCALNDSSGAKCASMQDAYKASRSMTSGSQVQSVFDGRGGATAAQGPQAPVVGQLSNYPDAAQQGAPVFQQPKVLRVWIAPYVDAEGNLRSGEYAYFSTPGSWNYGTLKKSGAASGIMEPHRPGNLGFQAEIVSPNTRNRVATTPAAPASTGAPSAPPPSAQASANGAYAAGTASTPPVATDSSGTITQPYQRISN